MAGELVVECRCPRVARSFGSVLVLGVKAELLGVSVSLPLWELLTHALVVASGGGVLLLLITTSVVDSGLLNLSALLQALGCPFFVGSGLLSLSALLLAFGCSFLLISLWSSLSSSESESTRDISSNDMLFLLMLSLSAFISSFFIVAVAVGSVDAVLLVTSTVPASVLRRLGETSVSEFRLRGERLVGSFGRFDFGLLFV